MKGNQTLVGPATFFVRGSNVNGIKDRRLRAWVWYEAMRKGRRAGVVGTAAPRELELEFYRIK
jgi:hypothetical protein